MAHVGPDGCSWETNFAISIELGLPLGIFFLRTLGNNLDREISECISMVVPCCDAKVAVVVYNCPSFGWLKAR